MAVHLNLPIYTYRLFIIRPLRGRVVEEESPVLGLLRPIKGRAGEIGNVSCLLERGVVVRVLELLRPIKGRASEFGTCRTL